MRTTEEHANFAELKRKEPPGVWHIRRRLRDSQVLIIAPHDGGIEPGTGRIAANIAGRTYSLYRFEGRSRALHITSHHFDEPNAVALAATCSIVLGIHGCGGVRSIYVGGRDTRLREDLAAALAPTGLRVKAYGHKYGAMRPLNICNRGSRRVGVQLEITRDLRRSREWRLRIAGIVRGVIERHLARLEAERSPVPQTNL